MIVIYIYHAPLLEENEMTERECRGYLSFTESQFLRFL
nr:MAG TPA: hypothetical protein [Caudoviricetes sp.]